MGRGICLKTESWAHTRNKLFTQEDRLGMHKLTGLLSIASFVYRYGVLYPSTGSLGFSEISWFNTLTAITHMLPPLVSIQFRVPKKRITSRPMVIYEEYRQHAVVFSLRCFSVFAFGQFMDMIPHQKITLPIVVLLHHFAVDWITTQHGTDGMTAIRVERGIRKDKDITIAIKRGYSFYQFLALGSHLIPRTGFTHAMGFNTNIAIQSSAFCMTLFRKGIIRARAHAAIYSLCLILSAFHIVRAFGVVFVFMIASAFFFRVRLGLSKYPIWAAFCIAYNLVEDYEIKASFECSVLTIPALSIVVYTFRKMTCNNAEEQLKKKE